MVSVGKRLYRVPSSYCYCYLINYGNIIIIIIVMGTSSMIMYLPCCKQIKSKVYYECQISRNMKQ